MKTKVVSIRISEDVYKKLKEKKIDINNVLKTPLMQLAEATVCPTCKQKIKK